MDEDVENKSKSKKLSKQTEMLKTLVDVNATQIPKELEYLDLICDCGPGERTIGMYAIELHYWKDSDI